MKNAIIVRGARQHNLKNIDVEIPRRSFTVITGPSGSGKSSLAFDTIYAEGQRRYVESLSAYARQFLERMEKPDVDLIEGLSPAVAIEQKNPTRTSRSTVGTATEIYDYLRLLWARIGRTFCPVCGRELRPDTVESVTDRLLALPAGTRFLVAFPLRPSARVRPSVIFENLRAQGFVRLSVDGRVAHLDDLEREQTDVTAAAELLVVVDRLVVEPEARGRVVDAVGTAFREGDGDCVTIFSAPVTSPFDGASVSRLAFTERFECPNDGTPASRTHAATLLVQQSARRLPDLQRLRRGARVRRVADRALSGALAARRRHRSVDQAAIRGQAPCAGRVRTTRGHSDLDMPWQSLPGGAARATAARHGRGWTGILPFLRGLEEKRYKQYIRVFLRQYQSAPHLPRPAPAPSCSPTRSPCAWPAAPSPRSPSCRSTGCSRGSTTSRSSPFDAAGGWPRAARGARPPALPARRGTHLSHAQSRHAHAERR